MTMTSAADLALLKLLQLASPALPVGAFSYSEGLETLVDEGKLTSPAAVQDWLVQEIRWGTIGLEVTVMLRSYDALCADDLSALAKWNAWLSALREGEELRQQSWQMGRALTRMVEKLHPELQPALTACGHPCNYAVAFGLTAAHWQIDPRMAGLGYLQSWATNLVNAAIKLIPLGQTVGQQLLLDLSPHIATGAEIALHRSEDDLSSSGWGVSLAAMGHEALYSRLFRS